MMALAGMVSVQAQAMEPATPQRTAEKRLVAPTPMMAPVMVWVVDTGMPNADAKHRVLAPPISAQKPPTGLSLVIFWPMGLTMPTPPHRPEARRGGEGGGRPSRSRLY